MAFCEFHLFRRVKAVAICENCGKVICKDHMYRVDSQILCEDCAPEDLKREKYKGIKGFFKKVFSKL